MKTRSMGWASVLMTIVCVLMAAPVLAQSTPCAGRAGTAFVNWPQFHSDPCHTGYNPNEFLLGSSTVGSLVLNWKHSFNSGDIAVANGAVYGFELVGSADNVYALNATTGSLLWKYSTVGNIHGSSPAVANGVVYVGSGDANVYALNASTGALIWKYTTGRYIDSAPAVANGVVYIASGDGYLYALNAGTGALIWKSNIGTYVGYPPAVANGMIYVGADDDTVHALDAATGVPRWSYSTHGSFDGSPVVVNGVVYAGCDDRSIYALDATTGVSALELPDRGTGLSLSCGS